MYYLNVTYTTTEKEEMFIWGETYFCLPLILGQICDRDKKNTSMISQSAEDWVLIY